jgi:hypothetical protein
MEEKTHRRGTQIESPDPIQGSLATTTDRANCKEARQQPRQRQGNARKPEHKSEEESDTDVSQLSRSDLGTRASNTEWALPRKAAGASDPDNSAETSAKGRSCKGARERHVNSTLERSGMGCGEGERHQRNSETTREKRRP